ncbi:GNAT family N-acetyltransferase [Mucilaginibacter sp. JRF]|uniref:GNAT family N-acetyltransferase n=1 Tax=Mucilaginibacter sp. JRF TaxID=2780088 RepID=UPI0018822A33|nr:GNAT family N-acetyltransferase [Mucilaginibacter sp. JRF]MBE9585136.1 GNAT family N-acetyltransferase [Mucilaginibacter sp. JRF]
MDTITLKRTNSTDPEFRTLIAELDKDLRERNGSVMDIYDQHNIIEYVDTVVIAHINNEPAGCGCFKPYDADAVEIKRMFVRAPARGQGISSKVLTELEKWATELGFKQTVLETGSKQTEALALYCKAGYTQIPPYGPYVDLPDSICFRKEL